MFTPRIEAVAKEDNAHAAYSGTGRSSLRHDDLNARHDQEDRYDSDGLAADDIDD